MCSIIWQLMDTLPCVSLLSSTSLHLHWTDSSWCEGANAELLKYLCFFMSSLYYNTVKADADHYLHETSFSPYAHSPAIAD